MAVSPEPTAANSYLVSALGMFVVSWSILDLLLDAAIIKQLKLDTKRGIMVTCGLGFEAKLSMLNALLHLHDPEFSDVIEALHSITATARRNVLLHGYISIGAEELEFTKIDAKGKLTVRSVKHSPDQFDKVIGEICKKIDFVAQRLDVSLAEREAIVNIGKNLANKSATSPTSSSQKRT